MNGAAAEQQLPSGLHSAVLERIGADLVGGDLPPGAALSMDRLEQRYGVSRSVVREVVRVLESMRVVSARRRVGVTVLPADGWDALSPMVVRWRLDGPGRPAQLRALSELRLAVEPVAASLAAARASAEQCGELTGAAIGMSVTGRRGDLEAYLRHDATFHRVLLTSTGNEMFAGLGDLVAEVLAGRTHHHLMPARPEPAAIRWHADIAEAVGAGDGALAERVMRQVVSEAWEAMSRAFPHDDGVVVPAG